MWRDLGSIHVKNYLALKLNFVVCCEAIATIDSASALNLKFPGCAQFSEEGVKHSVLVLDLLNSIRYSLAGKMVEGPGFGLLVFEL